MKSLASSPFAVVRAHDYCLRLYQFAVERILMSQSALLVIIRRPSCVHSAFFPISAPLHSPSPGAADPGLRDPAKKDIAMQLVSAAEELFASIGRPSTHTSNTTSNHNDGAENRGYTAGINRLQPSRNPRHARNWLSITPNPQCETIRSHPPLFCPAS